LDARPEFRMGQKTLLRSQIEEQAARKLRIPEPTVTGGFKRGNVPLGLPPEPFADATRTAVAFAVSVPIPIFNKGQYEVARAQAQQAQIEAEQAALARRIRAEVETANGVLAVRRDALAAYKTELESAGTELTRIAQLSYQEGEVGILELLDSERVNRAASLRLLDLRASVKEAFIELERAVGEEVRP
jgi:cobalt-zinc-cadmium efflux system outer membrane protein